MFFYKVNKLIKIMHIVSADNITLFEIHKKQKC